MAIDTSEANQPVFLLLGPAGSGLSTALNAFREFHYVTVAGVNLTCIRQSFASLSEQHPAIAFHLALHPHNSNIHEAKSALEAFKLTIPNLKIGHPCFQKIDKLLRSLGKEMRCGNEHPFQALAAVGRAHRNATHALGVVGGFGVATAERKAADDRRAFVGLEHACASNRGGSGRRLELTIHAKPFGARRSRLVLTEYAFERVNEFGRRRLGHYCHRLRVGHRRFGCRGVGLLRGGTTRSGPHECDDE